MIDESEQWGSIKVGSHSDLVLLDNNPLEDIDNTKYVAGVVVNGQFLTRSFIIEGQLEKLQKQKKMKIVLFRPVIGIFPTTTVGYLLFWKHCIGGLSGTDRGDRQPVFPE